MGEYELLSKIKSPHDVKKLNDEQLEKLCTEIREKLVETVSVNGGHLSPNLGVVELTVALERSFNLPKDSIVWDVGHQAYTHYNDFLVQECQRSGFTPNVTCHCYDTPMAMQMVLSGFGISFLPKSILSTHPGAPLKAKPVRGLPIRSYAVLAWNSAVLSAPCVQRFVEEKMT